MLIVAVCFLVLIPLSPASIAAVASSSVISHSFSSLIPSFTFSHSAFSSFTRPTGGVPSFTFSHTSVTTHDPPSFTFSHTSYTTHDPPSFTFSHSWVTTWSSFWSTTWSRFTRSFPTYTSTEYVPVPIYAPGCDPYNPYCNGYSQYPCSPNDPYCNGYSQYCYPGYPGYPYACYPSSPSYPYQYQTSTTASTTTSYSTLTQTSLATATSTFTPQPAYVTNTLTLTTTTANTTMETVYGTLMAVFLALFLASLFLLMTARSRTPANMPQTTGQQAYVATSYRCSSCGNDVLPTSKFCGRCGVPLKS